MNRPLLPLAALALATQAAAAAEAEPAPPTAATQPATRHITQTYLRALPGKRAALIDYIRRNWFAMDRIGIARGLFTSYSLLDRAEGDDADWDVIVMVGYPTPEGHEAPGVAEAFRAIRAAHREEKIDGLGFAQLGVIVRHYPLVVADQSAGAPAARLN
ncbi:MAG: hypothetical protein A4S16_11265 [Proteobacteria bacterium SG_bin6]|nr:MAG: hypothetical protein A4S16_11265 [Proteobacteria bacterium SG_bin6]